MTAPVTAPVTRDDDLLAGLAAIVGERGLLTGPDVALRSCDPFRSVPIARGIVVRPASTDEVSRVLAFCHARGQRVVTHGGRTGVAGGAYAGEDEIVLSLERMNAIEQIDPVGHVAIVQAGAVLEAVQTGVAERGLFYPIDLGAKGSATIGGTISTNAGGNRVIRWGMTRQNILGLEAVLADGTVVSSMNRMLKNNSGYDLKQLFVGAEGTLGVVTRAVLRLVPLPSSHSVAFVSVAGYAQLLELLASARRLMCLSAFEVMWRDYYATVASTTEGALPVPADQPYYALVESMGYDGEADAAHFAAFLEQAYEAGLIVEAVTAGSAKQAAALWAIREVPEGVVRAMKPFVTFDVSIDIARAEAFVDMVRQRLTARYAAVRTVAFGHLGDNNIHLGISIGPDTPTQEIAIERVVYALVREFDGALTAEHGIGQMKRDFLPEHRSAGEMNVMRRVRAALDPAGLLNHEVMFQT